MLTAFCSFAALTRPARSGDRMLQDSPYGRLTAGPQSREDDRLRSSKHDNMETALSILILAIISF